MENEQEDQHATPEKPMPQTSSSDSEDENEDEQVLELAEVK